MKIGMAAAVFVAGMTVPGLAQMTGVSHPDEVGISTSPEGVQQPVLYQGAAPVAAAPVAPVARPVLQASVAVAPMVSDDLKLAVRPDPDANVVTRLAGPANELPVGTVVKVKLQGELSTKSTVAGTVFTAALTEPVMRDGRVLLPTGSTLTGKVTEVHGGKRISGKAALHLVTENVTLPDGMVYPVHGQVIDTDLLKAAKVDEEGTILHKGNTAQTVTALTLATGSGAVSGALLGGWPGAIIGAGVGAGISTVVWLKQDRQTELPQGTGISFMLTEPVRVGER